MVPKLNVVKPMIMANNSDNTKQKKRYLSLKMFLKKPVIDVLNIRYRLE